MRSNRHDGPPTRHPSDALSPQADTALMEPSRTPLQPPLIQIKGRGVGISKAKAHDLDVAARGAAPTGGSGGAFLDGNQRLLAALAWLLIVAGDLHRPIG